MIPTRYTLYPTAALRRSDVPIHLRWTYLVLYALAWTHQYEWLNETYQQLAGTFTALEGREIGPQGIRRRLDRLAEFGLIERRRTHSQEWRTYLLVRHDAVGATGSSTQEALGATVEGHPISNKTVVLNTDIVEETENTQHLLLNRGATDENRRLLEAMGVFPKKARALAQLPHVTPEYLEGVMEYRAGEAARGKVLGPGWVVTTVAEAEQMPDQEPEPEGRYRYIQGKYKEFVRH